MRNEVEMFRGENMGEGCDVGGMMLGGHHSECGDGVSQGAGSGSGNRGSAGRSGNDDGEIGAANATHVNPTYCQPRPKWLVVLVL